MSWHVCMQEIPLNECVQTHRPLSNDDHQSQSISLSASLNFDNNLFYIILMHDRLCIIMCMNNAMTVENYTIWEKLFFFVDHYDDVIMGAMATQITSLAIVYSTVYSDSASLAFVRGIHRGPVNSPHKWPVARKMFPFRDVIMVLGHKPETPSNGSQ